ncbi:MAG: hypothetical protein M1292_08090 [Bacteroidetes bacterium]|nr:hypothetical protein [Bacteroidota bacterium]
MDNRINVVLPPENRESIFQAVRNVKNGLPFLVKLSKAERDALLKIDDGRKPFVEKSIELATRNAELDPGLGLLADAPKDVDLYSFLFTLENDLNQLLESVRDTKQLAGAEAFKVARLVYDKAKMNVKLGIPGSQAIVDELGKLFKQKTQPMKAVEVK